MQNEQKFTGKPPAEVILKWQRAATFSARWSLFMFGWCSLGALTALITMLTAGPGAAWWYYAGYLAVFAVHGHFIMQGWKDMKKVNVVITDEKGVPLIKQ